MTVYLLLVCEDADVRNNEIYIVKEHAINKLQEYAAAAARSGKYPDLREMRNGDIQMLVIDQNDMLDGVYYILEKEVQW
jgi:hypothetical protein